MAALAVVLTNASSSSSRPAPRAGRGHQGANHGQPNVVRVPDVPPDVEATDGHARRAAPVCHLWALCSEGASLVGTPAFSLRGL
jgi:hypothetical protein